MVAHSLPSEFDGLPDSEREEKLVTLYGNVLDLCRLGRAESIN
jgi:hypothetical protein